MRIYCNRGNRLMASVSVGNIHIDYSLVTNKVRIMYVDEKIYFPEDKGFEDLLIKIIHENGLNRVGRQKEYPSCPLSFVYQLEEEGKLKIENS